MLARPMTEMGDRFPPAGEPAAERSSVFARAARHSRNVRILKVVLPVVGVVMAGLFAAQSYLASPPAVSITTQDSQVEDGKLVMSSPKLEGFTADGRPYSVSARRAVQDVADEAVVVLEGIAAQVPIDAGVSATIDAAHGVLDRWKNTIDFDSAIDVRTSDGATVRLRSAMLDIAGGRMSTGDPVDIRYDGASIEADGMSVSDGGKVVVFEKRVRVHILPRAGRTAGQ